MTTPATIRVRRADGTETDLPADTPAWDTRSVGMRLCGAYASGVRSVRLIPPSWANETSMVMVELPIERAARLDRELASARTENAAIRLRACDAHAAVYRAMRASPEDAYAACQDDGYVHVAVHRVLDGPDGAEARWGAAVQAHVEELGARALRAEEEVERLRVEMAGMRAAAAGVLDATAAHYPRDIFPDDGTTLDAASAKFARTLVASIRHDIAEALDGSTGGTRVDPIDGLLAKLKAEADAVPVGARLDGGLLDRTCVYNVYRWADGVIRRLSGKEEGHGDDGNDL